ncbi:MAG: twin-arginine translocase subunit TatB [Magnetococcales bacterium]|nr:twin-arginine translocase subunit TatB [Magnetococcales bacterium]
MLDMGWAELLVIAIVALLAVGPEKLPEVAQGLARMVRQVRRIVGEFREAVNLEEFDAQIRQSSQKMAEPIPARETVPAAGGAVAPAPSSPHGGGETGEGDLRPLTGAVVDGEVLLPPQEELAAAMAEEPSPGESASTSALPASVEHELPR